MNKIYIYILLVFTAALSISCKKYLEIEPKNAVSDERTIYDVTSAQTAIRGVYRSLGHANYYGETFVTIGYFAGGDIVNNTTGGAQNLADANFRSDDGLFNTTWIAIYSTINRANEVIEKVPEISGEATVKNQLLGETHFIRALAYFDLARAFGGVQLILTPTKTLSNNPSTGIQRGSLDETYNQISKDLDLAESLLPATVTRVRASKSAARALRSRLLLYRQDWANAEAEATKLIKDNNLRLVTPFNAWFAGGITGSQESIFEVAYSSQNPSTLRGQMQHPTKGGTYRYAPNGNTVNLLKNPAIGGGRTGRRALIDSIKQGSTILWQGNLYYRNPATDPSYVLRIAEQYLIRAEARAHLGQIDSSRKDINTIRVRANLAPFKNDTLLTEDDLLLAIENERRFEFLWEGHRWFDLARTGRAKAVLEALKPNVKVDPHERFFPIPVFQIQLDASLTQNPGY